MVAQRVPAVIRRSGVRHRRAAKAFVVLTENGPLLILTNFPGIGDRRVKEVLSRRGFNKFIAYSLPIEHVRRAYGVPFEVISAELQRVDAVRVLDYDGARIFDNFSLSELDHPFSYEA